jgi:hypothetical protein
LFKGLFLCVTGDRIQIITAQEKYIHRHSEVGIKWYTSGIKSMAMMHTPYDRMAQTDFDGA